MLKFLRIFFKEEDVSLEEWIEEWTSCSWRFVGSATKKNTFELKLLGMHTLRAVARGKSIV